MTNSPAARMTEIVLKDPTCTMISPQYKYNINAETFDDKKIDWKSGNLERLEKTIS